MFNMLYAFYKIFGMKKKIEKIKPIYFQVDIPYTIYH